MFFSHSMTTQIPQGHSQYLFGKGKNSSILTSTRTTIIILLFIGMARDVGLHYCNRKMMEQELHCIGTN